LEAEVAAVLTEQVLELGLTALLCLVRQQRVEELEARLGKVGSFQGLLVQVEAAPLQCILMVAALITVLVEPVASLHLMKIKLVALALLL
jgi:hypothetical protein